MSVLFKLKADLSPQKGKTLVLSISLFFSENGQNSDLFPCFIKRLGSNRALN